MNVITVSGHVGKEVEMKYFESGSIVANFPLAATYYDHKTKENKTFWLKCQVWGKKAEFTGEYVKKGNKVIVTGNFFIEEFKDKEGKSRTVNCISVNDIEQLGKKTKSEEQSSESSSEENIVEFTESDEFIGEDEIPF